ncbi:MAG: MlaD family protein [Sumerlaeia bacterium]
MSDKRTNDVLVGLVVLASFVALTVMTLTIRSEMIHSTIKISAIYDNVSGLEVGSPVLISGIRKGRVSSIRAIEDSKPGGLREQKVLVGMIVRDDITLYSNARIKLVQQGFIGDKRVEIEPGSEAGGEPIASGAVLPGVPPMDIELAIKQFQDIADDVQATVAQVRDFVDSDETVGNISKALEGVGQTVEELNLYLADNRENVTATVANARSISDRTAEYLKEGGKADRITEEAARTLETTRGEVQELSAKAEDVIARADRIASELELTLGHVRRDANRVSDSAVAFMDTTKEDFKALSQDAAETSENLNAILGKVRRGEGTVGRLVNDPAPFEDLKASAEALRNFLLRSERGFYDTRIPYGEGTPQPIESNPMLDPVPAAIDQ